MPVKMRRRRVKKRRRPGDISRMKFVWIIAIMILAVFLGYLTAKFVIGPLLGYNADESPIKIAGNETSQSEDDKDNNGNAFSRSAPMTTAFLNVAFFVLVG